MADNATPAAQPQTPQAEPAIDYDALARAYVHAQSEQADGDGQRGTPPAVPALNANAGQEPEAKPEVKNSRESHWRKRAARWILAHIKLGDSSRSVQDQGKEMLDKLVAQTLTLSESQVREERAEAERVIASRSYDLGAQGRTRAYLDAFEDGLGDVRALVGSRTMSTLTDPAGGYLVPTPMLAELLMFVEEYGYVRSMFRNVTMTSDSMEWSKLGTKPVAAWYGEIERIEPSDMTFAEGRMNSSKLAGITSWSKELDEDSLIALLPLYTQLMGEAIAEQEDLAGLKGDGTSTYGGFKGILNLTAADGANIYTMGSGDTSSADIDLEDLIAAKQLLSKSRRSGGRWLFNESTVTALITLKRNSEANNYILLDPNSPDRIASFLGYPLVDPEGVEDSFFPTDGVSTVFGAFGNFSRSIFGIRRGFTIETSDKAVLNNSAGAVTLNAMQQDAVIAKVTERVGIGHPQPDAYTLFKTAAS